MPFLAPGISQPSFEAPGVWLHSPNIYHPFHTASSLYVSGSKTPSAFPLHKLSDLDSFYPPNLVGYSVGSFQCTRVRLTHVTAKDESLL